jgi:hypothetical protein
VSHVTHKVPKPEETTATLGIDAVNIAMIILGAALLRVNPWLGTITLLAGIIGVAGAIIFFESLAGIPIGTAERIAVYPSLAMVVVLGVYLLMKTTRKRHATERRPRPSGNRREVPDPSITGFQAQDDARFRAPVRGEALTGSGSKIFAGDDGADCGHIRVDQLRTTAEFHAPKRRCRFEDDEHTPGITREMAELRIAFRDHHFE